MLIEPAMTTLPAPPEAENCTEEIDEVVGLNFVPIAVDHVHGI
mgnify:CR=1 FL=1